MCWKARLRASSRSSLRVSKPMFWRDDVQSKPDQCSKCMVDLAFKLSGRDIPVEHARDLNQAVTSHLPWLGDQTDAGIHLIHGAASGNGWLRPGGQSAALVLSRRTCLILRLPMHRLEQAKELQGAELLLEGHALRVGVGTARPIRANATQFARYVAGLDGEHEENFVDRVAGELVARRLHFSKLLCGRSHEIRTPDESIFTRGLMVAGLDSADSITLQEQSLGSGRLFGCGLFLPHKGIETVTQTGPSG